MSYLTHFCCESEQLGRYAILTQSPTHAKAIAEKIGAEAVSKGDLYHIYTGKVGRQAVSVISCGIGSPAAALALEELSLCGTTTVLRIGTAQPLAHNTKQGDVVIATAGVKMDGTSSEYVVMEFPAVSNFEVTRTLVEEAEKQFGKGGYRLGIVEGRDVYTRRKDFDRTLVSGTCIYEKALGRGNVLCSDMETAAVLVVARYLGIRAGSINLVGSDAVLFERCIELALAALERLAQSESAEGACLLT